MQRQMRFVSINYLAPARSKLKTRSITSSVSSDELVYGDKIWTYLDYIRQCEERAKLKRDQELISDIENTMKRHRSEREKRVRDMERRKKEIQKTIETKYLSDCDHDSVISSAASSKISKTVVYKEEIFEITEI